MGSSQGDGEAAVAEIHAAVDALAAAGTPGGGVAALALLRGLETVQRRITGLGYALIREVAEESSVEFGGRLARDVLADTLRITRADASARIGEAADLAPRMTMTGQPVGPPLAATAARVAAGEIGREHVRIVRRFVRGLPAAVDAATREHAETELATVAATLRPDQLARAAAHLDAILNPDGSLDDDRDRARKRGIRIGEQQRDGMSTLTGTITPELRAYLEAVFAKLARPGMCNPDDPAPATDSDPATDNADTARSDQAERDARSKSQRRHDALHAALRNVIASGELGQHRGLPVTVIVTTTLQDLETAAGAAPTPPPAPRPWPHPEPPASNPPAPRPGPYPGPASNPPPSPPPPAGRPAPGGMRGGKARTAGGTLIPYRDLIRMATHAYHYLAVFDRHTEQPLYLGRSKRLATPDQRIVATAQYGGCTYPGCPRPALDCEYHHCTDWAAGGDTDITDLAPTCREHHTLADHGWTVRRHPTGPIQWLPPAWHDPHRQPRINTYHRPADHYRTTNRHPAEPTPGTPTGADPPAA